MTYPIIQWQRIDPDGPGLSAPQREGDVGWDLSAAEDIYLPPHQQVDVPTNVRVKLPENTWAEMRSRSSMARLGIWVAATVIDNGFTGPLFMLVRNMSRFNGNSNDMVRIRKGERIGQLVLHQAVWAESIERDFEHDPRRGEAAFGSTGRI